MSVLPAEGTRRIAACSVFIIHRFSTYPHNLTRRSDTFLSKKVAIEQMLGLRVTLPIRPHILTVWTFACAALKDHSSISEFSALIITPCNRHLLCVCIIIRRCIVASINLSLCWKQQQSSKVCCICIDFTRAVCFVASSGNGIWNSLCESAAWIKPTSMKYTRTSVVFFVFVF